jgi:hypothetical protein
MAETIADRLDEAVSALPEDAACSLFYGPGVYHALLDICQPSEDRPLQRATGNVVFTGPADAWRLEYDGKTVAEGTMEGLE